MMVRFKMKSNKISKINQNRIIISIILFLIVSGLLYFRPDLIITSKSSWYLHMAKKWEKMNYIKSLYYINKAKQLDSSSIEIIVLRTHILRNLGRFEAAENELKLLETKAGYLEVFHHMMARIMINKNQYETAIEHINNSIELDINNNILKENNLILGIVFFLEKNYNDAISEFKKCINAPDNDIKNINSYSEWGLDINSIAYFGIGQSLCRLNKCNEGQRYINQGKKLDKSSEQNFLKIANIN